MKVLTEYQGRRQWETWVANLHFISPVYFEYFTVKLVFLSLFGIYWWRFSKI